MGRLALGNKVYVLKFIVLKTLDNFLPSFLPYLFTYSIEQSPS